MTDPTTVTVTEPFDPELGPIKPPPTPWNKLSVGKKIAALAMMLFGMQRTHNLTGLRALATAGIAVAVISVAIGGVFAVSPSPAQASPNDSAPTFTYSTTDSPDIQLPTLPLGG